MHGVLWQHAKQLLCIKYTPKLLLCKFKTKNRLPCMVCIQCEFGDGLSSLIEHAIYNCIVDNSILHHHAQCGDFQCRPR